jgi:[CysO sulfur-carrier protein]-S-L-cysteine hydrolase
MIQKEGKRHVVLNQAAQQALVDDVYQRADIEACGVLIGSLSNNCWSVERAHPLRNIAHSAVYFEFAPEDLLAVELAYPGQIVGVYHSHPTGYARASSTDRENMQRINQEEAIPWIWLIICGPFDSSLEQERSQGMLEQRLIAYHHYQEEGLQRVAVRFALGTL